jgi:mycothiol synthase
MTPSLLGQGYRVRPPHHTEAEAVLALLVARDIADIGAPDIVLQDLRDEWGSSDFDICTDARVVQNADGRVVGYAAMSHPGMLIVVAPDHEGRGLGSRLRHWAEQRDRARGSAGHRQWIAANNTSARALLLAAGYRPVRSYWRLGRKLEALDMDGPPPVEVTLRPVDVDGDAAVLHALNETSFKASPDHEPYSLDRFHAEHLRAHDFDAELSSVAEHRGQAIAFLLARRWPERDAGFVDLLGVHPDHRTRGLGTAMLRAAFARFAAAGLRAAELGVASDNPKAMRLYERAGMTPRFRYDTYERAACC